MTGCGCGAAPAHEEIFDAMRVVRSELASGRRYEAGRIAEPGTRQNGSRPAEWSGRAVIGLLYAPVPWIVRLIVATHFRHFRVRHHERLPARGPVLLVANHPATWTDAAVLISAVGRRLHFLAQETLFRPRPRAWILRLFGALPVAKRGDGPDRTTRNAGTFRTCRAILARGEVVAVFPEGVSAGDRSVEPLKTGAARIALDAIANRGPLTLVPVGIHYADRRAFRSDVVVSVGPPLHLEAVPDAASNEAWIEELTTRIRTAIAELIVDVPDPSLRWLVEEVVPLDPSADAGSIERSRRVARHVARLRQRSPRAFADCERHARSHLQLRARLHLGPGDLDATSTAALRAFTAIAALPAAAGWVLNAPPAALTAIAARRYSDPVRVGLARIVAGIAWFAGWYTAIAIVVTWKTGSGWTGLAAVLATAALGMFTLVWGDAWSSVRGSSWVLLLEWLQPRLLARLRRERGALRSSLQRRARPPRGSRGAVARGGGP